MSWGWVSLRYTHPTDSEDEPTHAYSAIINEIIIYDLTVRQVSSYIVNQRAVSLQINQPPGVYLIKVFGDDFEDIKKLIVS